MKIRQRSYASNPPLPYSHIQVFIKEKNTTKRVQNGNISLGNEWRSQKTGNKKQVKWALPLSSLTYYQVEIIVLSKPVQFSSFSSRKSLHAFLFLEELNCKPVISVFSLAAHFQGLEAILISRINPLVGKVCFNLQISVGQNSSDGTALGEQMPIWKNPNTLEKHTDRVKILMTFTGILPRFMSARLPTSSANISRLTMKIKCENKVKLKKKKGGSKLRICSEAYANEFFQCLKSGVISELILQGEFTTFILLSQTPILHVLKFWLQGKFLIPSICCRSEKQYQHPLP